MINNSSCPKLQLREDLCECCIAALEHKVPECLVKCKWSWHEGHFNIDDFKRYVCHYNGIAHKCMYNTHLGYLQLIAR